MKAKKLKETNYCCHDKLYKRNLDEINYQSFKKNSESFFKVLYGLTNCVAESKKLSEKNHYIKNKLSIT